MKKEKKPSYTVSVKILGKVHTAKGKTFDEAVSKLEIRNPKGMSVWTVEYEGQTRERIIMPALTQKVFTLKGTAYEIAFKNIRQLFV